MSPTAPGCLASLDGTIAPAGETLIPATDDGLLRGDGIFEVIRVYDGRPFMMDAHMERLARSGANLRLEVDVAAVRADAERLLAQAGTGPEHQALRVVITRGGRRLLLTEPLAAHAQAPSIRLGTVVYAPTRVLDGIKSLSYGANMLSTRLAVERGFDEALLVTPHGRVLEAPTSTFFWVTSLGELLTPPLSDHILASITRTLVIEETGARERVCTREDLATASEAFLASTVVEVQPVAAIDALRLPVDGPVTQHAAAAFARRVAFARDGHR